MLLQVLVDLDNLARNRAVEIGGGLDRLDHPQPGSRFELLSDRRKLQVDDIAELRLCVLTDTNRYRAAAFLPDPFVRLAELQRGCHRASSLLRMRPLVEG